jgi:hypothetical protein
MKIINIAAVLISLALGASAGAWYQKLQHTYKSEEIIAKEIMLLEKHRGKPNCEVVLNAETNWGATPTNDGIIVWRYDADKRSLKKVIVDNTMTTAYEELVFSCSKKKSN